MPAVTVARWTEGLRLDATLPTGSVVALDPDPLGTLADAALADAVLTETTLADGPLVDVDPRTQGSKPSQLLLAALAGCTGMDVISICRKKRVVWQTYEVEVRGEQHDTHPRTWRTIEVEHRFVGDRIDDAAVARAVQLSATRYCPVSAHLSAGDTAIHHRYRISDATGSREGLVVITGPFGAGLDPIARQVSAPA